MRWLLILAAALLISLSAMAQFSGVTLTGGSVGGAGGGGGAFSPSCPSGLCDLNIDPSRFTNWSFLEETEAAYTDAQSWTEYDVTCGANPCSSGKETIRTIISAGTCANLVDTTNVGSRMDCFIDNAPDDVVLYVPANASRYAASGGWTISNDRLVIRGAGPTETIIERTSTGRSFVNSGDCNANTGAMLVSVCTGAPRGTGVSWTDGYAEEDYTVTLDCGGANCSGSGFTAGGWILLRMTNTTACLWFDDVNAGGWNQTGHISKIVSTGTNTVTMDSPLRYQYDATGCTGWTAYPYTPLTKVGIEDLRLTTTTGIATGSDSSTNIKFEMFVYYNTALSWMVGVDVDRVYDIWGAIRESARNWYQGNHFSNTDSSVSFNTEGLYPTFGATDIYIENNWFTAPRVAIKLEGAEATVVAYNYFDVDATNGERCAFNHGHATRATLFEGNECDDELLLADMWWGRNLRAITAYRNRSTRETCSSPDQTPLGITFDTTGSVAPPYAADRPNVIGNTAWAFTIAPFQNAYTCSPPRRDNESLNTENNLIWTENNTYRYNDAQSFDMSNPTGTTSNRSCGTAFDDTCLGTNEYHGTGVHSTAAAGSFPNTLYRDRSTQPTWWCSDAEACSWDFDGIGAWGDNFGGTLCKLPAQIRAEAGTCTPP